MASNTAKSREEAEALLRSRAASDRAFREELLRNPHAAIKQAVGMALPADLKVTVLEETARQIYMVLPATSGAAEELSDQELAAISGGVAPGPPDRFEKAKVRGGQAAVNPALNPGGFNPGGFNPSGGG